MGPRPPRWWGLQDTPPGTAALALAARADVAPEALEELVLVLVPAKSPAGDTRKHRRGH